MLFNSHVFIFAFLPVVLFGFYLIGHYRSTLAPAWLAMASLFFYGWWDSRFVALLVGSIIFNYGAACAMTHCAGRGAIRRSKLLLALAVAANLAMLGYFKYAHFFAENINRLTGTNLPLGEVFLPLGISFFTFTQIAFLADTCQGKVKERNFVHYLLFVTYFPHLIAGPILHHKEMMPQFANRNICRINPDNLSAGLGIFVLGLAKKLWIADPLGEIANPIFTAVAGGGHPMMFEAWAGAIAYTLQLYFDFSGYCDMAIGLSLLFNVRLPLNFDSPYKSTSIIEFWRRWHITLSRYLRDYLYIPLGGNRRGALRRYGNLLVTMLIGGFWHGAGWTFVIWGGLHGVYLTLNHAWRALKKRNGWAGGGRFAAAGSGALSFTAVVVGWVFFRADRVATALAMLRGMAGMNGYSLPAELKSHITKHFARKHGISFHGLTTLTSLDALQVALLLAMGLAFVWGMPNVRQLFSKYQPTCEEIKTSDTESSGWLSRLLKWEASAVQGAFCGLVFALLILYMVSVAKSEFLYFQF